MENLKKLSLKRKPTVQKVVKEIKTQKINDVTTQNNVGNQHVCILSSDSEEGARPIQEMKTNPTTDGKRRFLDVADPHLLQLRKCILRATDSAASQCLLPFPAQTNNEVENECLPQENLYGQGRLLIPSKCKSSVDLSPFPPMCDWCRRRSSLNHQELSDAIRSLCRHGDCKSSTSEDVSAENGAFENKVLGRFMKESLGNNIGRKDNRTANGNQSTKNTEKYLNGKNELRVNHISSNQEDVPNAGRLPELVNQQTPSGSRVSGSPTRVNACDFNNSHLMRDRNSNFYSMQSSNLRGASVSSNIVKKRSLSTDEDTDTCNDSNHQVENKHLTKKQRSDPQRKPKSSGTKTHQGHRTSKVDNSNAQNQNCSNADAVAGACGRNESQANLRLDDKSAKSSSKSPLSADLGINSKRSESIQHPGTSSSSSEQVSSTSPAGLCTRKDLPLQKCPLCQVEFQHGTSQLEIDSHLAQCLSVADDDVIW